MKPRFDVNHLRQRLEAPERFILHYFPQMESTNSWLVMAARNDAPAGKVVIADAQTAGRGRLGRRWEDTPGRSILLSLLVRDLPSKMNPLMLTYWISLQMADAIEETVPGVHIRLKWPNDLFLRGKKLGGILIEGNFTANKPQFFVIGIGVNVNQQWNDFPAEIRDRAISLRLVTGTIVSRESIVAAFLNRCTSLFEPDIAIHPPTLLREYKKRLLYLGEVITVNTGKGSVKGRLVDLTSEGFLILATEEGDKMIHSGEIFYET